MSIAFLTATLAAGQQQPASAAMTSPSSPPIPKLTEPSVTKDSAGPLAPPSSGENWNTLSLRESGLNLGATGAVLLSKYVGPDYTRELLQVEWRPGDPIDLYIVLPHVPVRPMAILYLYNYTSDTERFRDDGWCRRATKDGVAAVGFVSALSGQRFHSPRPLRQWFVSELQEALATSTHDVQMVLNYLATRRDVDLSRVGIFGQDSGGAIAILAAAVDPRITALDVIDPWGDWPDWLRDSRQIPGGERGRYLTPGFLAKVANLDPATYLPRLERIPVRVQQVMDDPVTPSSAKDNIAAAVSHPGDLVRYPDQVAQIQSWRRTGLSGWLSTQLKAVTRFPPNASQALKQ